MSNESKQHDLPRHRMLGWIAPYEWQWWLPPISLWAAAIAAVRLIFKLSSLSLNRKEISS